VLGFTGSPVDLALTGSNAPTMAMVALLLLAFGWALAQIAKPRNARP
jgi:hypothetical protein